MKINSKKIFTKLFITLFFSLISLFSYSHTFAATYYVSSSDGDDTCTGLSQTAYSTGLTACPIKTLTKVSNTTFQPGDNILLKKGDTFYQNLTVTSSGTDGNPITYGAYGTGDNPIIDGADTITGMTNYSTNIWQKTGITIQPNLMYLNGTVGMPKTSILALTSERDWYWASSTKVFYVYSTSDPSGNIELGQRGKIVNLVNRSYITLKNLTLQNSNDIAYSAAVYTNYGSNNITIDGCTIRDNGYYGISLNDASNLVINDNTIINNKGDGLRVSTYTGGDSNVAITNNTFDYNSLNNANIFSSDGVTPHLKNITVYGNSFDNAGAAGFYIHMTDSVDIYNNTFDGNGNGLASYEQYSIGIEACSDINIYDNVINNTLGDNSAIEVWASGAVGAGHSDNVKIFRNQILNSSGYVLLVSPNGNTVNNFIFYSNVVAGAGRTPLTFAGTESGTRDTVHLFNNTFYNTTAATLYSNQGWVFELKNNIFHTPNNTSIIHAATSVGFLLTSNNLWYRPSGNVLSYNSQTYTTATITNFEATAQTTDPLFTNASSGNFTLQQASPAINAGVDVGLTEDILGNPIVGLPDIGAYEFQTIPTPDTTKPTISSFTIPSTSTTLSVPISTLTASDNTRVTGYLLSESGSTPSAGSGSWTSNPPTTYLFTTEGTKTLYAWTKDNAGNISTSISRTTTITLPVVTPPSGGGGGGGGGGNTPSLTDIQIKAKSKDVKIDGIINILDFNIVMVNWNQTYSNQTKAYTLSKGDITGDNKIDIFDINQIMVYWGVRYER